MRVRPVVALGLIGWGILTGVPRAPSAEDGVCKVPQNYPTLQSAVDDPLCLVVHAAPTTYPEQLVIRRSLTLAGSTWQDLISTLRPPATMTAPNALVTVIGRKVRLKVKHFVFEGPGPADGLIGIRMGKDTQLTIRDALFRDIRPATLPGTGNFFAIHSGVPADPQVTKLTITGVRFQRYHGAAIIAEGPGNLVDISLTNVGPASARSAASVAPLGIVVRDGALATIYRNDVAGHRHPDGGGIGILLDRPAATTSVQYTAVRRSDTGVKLLNGTGLWVYRSSVKDGGNGIVLEGAATRDNLVQNNRADGGLGIGLRLIGAVANRIMSNEFRAFGGDGIHVSAASADNVFRNNRSENNGGLGIRDMSTGARTLGTANTYAVTNYCHGNALGHSAPPGLCAEPPD